MDKLASNPANWTSQPTLPTLLLGKERSWNLDGGWRPVTVRRLLLCLPLSMFLWAELVSDSGMLLAVLEAWLSAPWGCWRNEELDLLGKEVVSPVLALDSTKPGVQDQVTVPGFSKMNCDGGWRKLGVWMHLAPGAEWCSVKVSLLIISLREWLSEGQAAAFSLLLREPPTHVCSNDNVKTFDHKPQKMQQISSWQQCWCFTPS